MNLWREIVSASIVGTERQNFELSSQGGDELSRILQSLKSDSDEIALLQAAAVIGAYRRNGVESATDREDLPEPAAAEQLKTISGQSEQHLAAMLAGNYPKVLPEFFELAAEKEKILPAFYLPEILDSGVSKRDLRKLILPVSGARGRWLAGYNQDWRWVLTKENAAEIWETGSRDERLFALETMRRENFSQARETLDAGWRGESAKDRAAFLEVLRINLNASDEEFLNKILQTDKSGDVRRAAFDLLLKIENSNLIKSLTERAAAIFRFKAGGFLSKPKVEISLPENFENQESSDLLNNVELFLNERELGKKAVKIVKLLHSVPPKNWEKKFSAEKKTIIEAAKRSDWEKALLSGLKSAAVNFADAEWLISILPHSREQNYYLLCNEIEREWTSPQIENLILLLLDGKTESEVNFDFAGQLFYRHKNIWSDDFTYRILDFLRQPAVEKDSQKSNKIIFQILGSGELTAAKYLHRFGEQWFAKLVEKAGEMPGNEKLTADFTAVTEFRREMHSAFQNEE